MVVSLGSGMTVKFFPLFFKNDANLTPTEVQVIYLIVPIVMVACSGIGQKMSKSLGRVQTIITVKSLGLSLLYILVFQGEVGRDIYIISYAPRLNLPTLRYAPRLS